MMEQNNGKAGDTVYIDNAITYDLTAYFGAGNEPSEEWCIENLLEKKEEPEIPDASYNLITNGNFDTGIEGWVTGAANPNTTLEWVTEGVGGYLKTTVINDSNIYVFSGVCSNQISLDSTHIYYGAVDLKVSSSVTSDVSASLFGNKTDKYAIKDNQWHTLTLYGNPSSTSTTWSAYVIELGSAKAGDVINIDNVMVYDLTAIFGAGNEPTEQWCSENL